MILPATLAAMKLGIRAGWKPDPVPARAAAAAYPAAYSRIVSTPRVTGDNTRLSDCFPTACCNAVEDWVYRLNDRCDITVPDADAIAAYEGMAGYVPSDPATDLGTVPSTGLAWWMNNPIAGYRLKMATPINPQAEADLRSAISRGPVLLCMELSVENQNQRVLTGVGTPGSWGGHAVCVDGYDGEITSGTSWGEPFYLDRSFFAVGMAVAAYALDLIPR